MSIIKEITAFKTEDGKTFSTREEAENHALLLTVENRLQGYLQSLTGSDKAKSRAAGAVRRFLLWEATTCPET